MLSSSDVSFVLFCLFTTVCVIFSFLFLPFFLSLEMSLFSEYFCTNTVSLCTCKRSASYVFSFRMVLFYLVTTGWIFEISSCENSINSIQSKRKLKL